MSNFDLNKQYALYLGRLTLNEKDMHPAQKLQLKQAFMGACGQMLILLRDELSALPEDEAVATMQRMIDQVGDYWLNQANKSN